jgi:hypothetical protein
MLSPNAKVKTIIWHDQQDPETARQDEHIAIGRIPGTSVRYYIEYDPELAGLPFVLSCSAVVLLDGAHTVAMATVGELKQEAQRRLEGTIEHLLTVEA